MTLLIKFLLFLHVIAGFTSLILFWLPIFTHKGGLNHRRIGNLYVKAMWVVVITALMLSINNLVTGDFIMAAFLGFLSLITAKPLWLGIATLKNKEVYSSTFRAQQIGFNLLLDFTGGLLVLYGFSLGDNSLAIYLKIFGVLGLLTVFDLISCFRNKTNHKQLYATHLQNMCTSAIAAYTAFFAFGASSVLEGSFSSSLTLVFWIAPTVIGTIGIQYALIRYNNN